LKSLLDASLLSKQSSVFTFVVRTVLATTRIEGTSQPVGHFVRYLLKFSTLGPDLIAFDELVAELEVVQKTNSVLGILHIEWGPKLNELSLTPNVSLKIDPLFAFETIQIKRLGREKDIQVGFAFHNVQRFAQTHFR
jgi:hypothetical protein